MRLRLSLSLLLTVLFLSACGGKATQTIASDPSPGAPLATSPTPGATVTVVGLVPAQTATAQNTLPLSIVPTPTPLATPLATRATTVNGTQPTAARPTTAPASPTARSPSVARMTDVPGVSPQETIGVAADGLVLLNVRVGKNEGFTRVVFDLAKQDGTAAPVPRTRLWREGDTVIVAFGGVRDDLFGQSLGGGEHIVNTGTVQSVYRIPIRDDTAAAYGIAVHGGAKATLSSVSSPTRVIVDIADA